MRKKNKYQNWQSANASVIHIRFLSNVKFNVCKITADICLQKQKLCRSQEKILGYKNNFNFERGSMVDIYINLRSLLRSSRRLNYVYGIKFLKWLVGKKLS